MRGDVAVDHVERVELLIAEPVRVVQGRGHADADVGRQLGVQAAARTLPRGAEHLLEVGAVDILQHQVGRALVLAGLDEARHVGAVQQGVDADLVAEHGGELLVAGAAGARALDHRQTAGAGPGRVAGQEDRAHAALAQLVDYLIAADL